MTFSHEARREYVLAALEKHERHLTRYAARMLGGKLDIAADVVQFAFMKLCEQGQKKSAGQLKAWLYTVCRNRIIDEFRKNGKQTVMDPLQFNLSLVDIERPDVDIERRERLAALKQRLDRLPEQDREVIDLWAHGFKHHEIAEIVSRKPGTVRVKIHRVIQLLKNELQSNIGADCDMPSAK